MIGQKIRNIRKSKNLTIVEFSEQINVTSGYISQIERDLISPSLTVLKRMSEALEIPLSVLFLDEESESVTVITKDQRTKIKPGNINVELEFLTPVLQTNDKFMDGQAFIIKVPPKTWVSNSVLIANSKECLYVMKGKIECHIGEKLYSISKGDSICFPENNGHLVYNPDEEESEIICILSPSIHI